MPRKVYKEIKVNKGSNTNNWLLDLLNHPFVAIFLTCLCLLAVFSLRQSAKKSLISKESIAHLEQSVLASENDLRATEAKVTDSQQEITLEKIRRNELLLKKDGELILQIPDEESPNSKDAPTQTKPNEIENGPWMEWKKLLRN